MKIFSKNRTIASMILAPIMNFLIGQMVVVIATIFITTKLTMEGIATEELLTAVTNEVLRYNVHLTGIASLISMPIAYFLLYEKQNRVISKVADYRKLLLVIPFGMAVCVAVNMLITLTGLHEFFPTYENLAETIFQGNILFELLAVGMLPAIVEELIYRGILYKGFKKFVPAVVANLISSLIFGAMHMNMVQFVYATILGILFAWVYEKYKSLWAPILMHMAANMFSVLMTEWTALQKFVETPYGSMLMMGGIVLGVTMVPFLIHRTVKKEEVISVTEKISIELSESEMQNEKVEESTSTIENEDLIETMNEAEE